MKLISLETEIDKLSSLFCELCRGKGYRYPHCFRCEDSGDDHDDCPGREICDHKFSRRMAREYLTELWERL